MEAGIEYMSGDYVWWTSAGSGPIDATSGYFYAPNYTWIEPWANGNDYPTSVTIQTIVKEKEVTGEVEKRTLFRVYVVDPRKTGAILMDGKLVIAENENQAMLKAGVAEVAQKINRELEQVDVYVQLIGTFIRPRKETQRVKIAKTEEED